MQPQELIPHLFRSEFSKLTAVLCRHMGITHIEAAEDIVSETFLSALENWSYKGLPPNPVAWLYTVAKNKCRNYIHRNQLFNVKIAHELRSQLPEVNETEIDLSEQNITDSQLRMLFVICHPSIAPEAQIGLSLRILCGFGIEEIANAFLVNKETINKRLYRAKEKLKAENVSIELPTSSAINERLDNVLTTLYLLFNEGYYSESHDSILREDLCLEAMKLVYLLLQNEQTNKPKVHALLSLMCFHSSRFAARKNQHGEIVLYHDQQESLWNYELIAKGAFHLKEASQGDQLSKYHLEAQIAYWHTIKTDSQEKWENILQLYNQLLRLEYSPVAALNRTFALSKAYGKQVAIREAEKLQLNNNHYYFILLGELYCNFDNEKASFNFKKALELAKNQTDRLIISNRIDDLLEGRLPTHCQ